MPTNEFSGLLTTVQAAPQNQRLTKLIQGIADQMQQSDNAQIQQSGQNLATLAPQFVKACQPT